jgi:signal peptidase
MQKALKIGYGIFVTAIIAFALLLVVSMFPIAGNYKVKIVMSGSMEPAIKTGSIVVIKPESTYAVGDVITFGKDTKKDVPTSHRIIAMRTQEGKYVYQVKGDANKSADMKEVMQGEVIGKVLFTAPYVGYLLDFAKKPTGFVLLIVVPAAVIIFDEVQTIWVETKKMRAKKEEVTNTPS